MTAPALSAIWMPQSPSHSAANRDDDLRRVLPRRGAGLNCVSREQLAGTAQVAISPRRGHSEGARQVSAPNCRRVPQWGPWCCPKSVSRSDVEVQGELVGVRTQPDRIHFVLALVVDPRLDEVRGEHVALQQELVIFF